MRMHLFIGVNFTNALNIIFSVKILLVRFPAMNYFAVQITIGAGN